MTSLEPLLVTLLLLTSHEREFNALSMIEFDTGNRSSHITTPDATVVRQSFSLLIRQISFLICAYLHAV